MTPLIALLRAVNVGGRRLVMADVRKACQEAGLGAVQTYLASGNLVFRGSPETSAPLLERLLAQTAGFDVPVMIRSQSQWAHYLSHNPMPAAAAEAPSRLYLAISKRAPPPGVEAALEARATAGETVRRCHDALVLHFPEGLGASKLTPALIDRLVGSPTTARNWNTVVALDGLARALAADETSLSASVPRPGAAAARPARRRGGVASGASPKRPRRR